MSATQAERDAEDCIVVRCRCGRVVIMSVVDRAIERSLGRDIATAVINGCNVEHMTAADCRKQDFGCRCTP